MSYWWDGSGGGWNGSYWGGSEDYSYMDQVGYSSSVEQIFDMTVFGPYFPGEMQTALNQYNQQVSTAFNNASRDSYLEQYNNSVAAGNPDNNALAMAATFIARNYGANPNDVLSELQNWLSNLPPGAHYIGSATWGFPVPDVSDEVISIGSLTFSPTHSFASAYNSLFDGFMIGNQFFDMNGNLTTPQLGAGGTTYGSPEDRVAASAYYAQLAQDARNRGDLTAAAHYEQLSRFFRVSDEERNTAMPGLSRIDRDGPGLVMSNANDMTPAERELDELRAQRAMALAQWDALDAGRDPNSNFSEQQFQVYYSSYQSYNGSWPTSSRLRSVEAMNGQRVANGQAALGALSLVSTALTWVATGQRMNQLGAWHAREEQLVRQIVNESTYLVPPRPENVSSYLNMTFGYGQAPAGVTENLTELSHAFWGY